MYDIFAVGNALVDHEYEVTEAQLKQTRLKKGSMTLAEQNEQQQLLDYLTAQGIVTSKQTGGGSAANTAFAIAALGGKPFYACRVGDDDCGSFYLHDMQAAGVTTSARSVATGTTGSCIVLITPDGERTMQTHLGTSAQLGEKDIDFDMLKDSQFIYLEGYLATSPTALKAITKLRQQAALHHVKTAMTFSDPAMVTFARQGLQQLLGNGVDVLFCNREEACKFTQSKTIMAAAQVLQEYAKLVVVTDGENGAFIFSEHEHLSVAASTVNQVIDTNGAGDNFAGAFLYAYTQSYSLKHCGLLAANIASSLVEQFGPRLSAHDYKDIAGRVLPI